jgi:cysteine synthase A
MGKRYENILQTVGRTPVVRINKLAPAHVNVYAKVEAFNPMGSVKDRLALGVIEDAERRGELRPGQTVVEATSGNTGIGLAMVCAQKGYPLVIVMAENFSVERRKLMRFLGAQVVLTPAAHKGSGMVAKAAELARAHGWWQPRQFDNPANAEVHARTTAVEILDDFDDVGLDFFVTGFGTGGTLNGVSRVLRERSPGTKIVVCEPANSAILASGIAQPAQASHPSFRPHVMQGWSPDFIPSLVQQVTDGQRIDAFLPIDGQEALRRSRELATQEGIFVGASAGATLAGALQVAQSAPAGSNILCMLPDTGERYLSTPLFDDVGAEMSAAELEISRSTQGFRFDAAPAPSVAPQPQPQPQPQLQPAVRDAVAAREVDALLGDQAQPVVVFGLEWCEFTWSIRKAFTRYGIPFRVVSLDSEACRRDDRGGRMRQVLHARTGVNTLPQTFVAGEFVGGCTEVFEDMKSSRLAGRLERAGVAWDTSANDDPYGFLPRWMQPR